MTENKKGSETTAMTRRQAAQQQESQLATTETYSPQKIAKITEVVSEQIAKCDPVRLRTLSPLQKAVDVATAMTTIRATITKQFVQAVFMPLQNTPLGFTTDRQNAKKGPKEYDAGVVRDCLIEGMMKGLQPVNNEIIIISGRAYMGKNGATRLVREFPGLTNIVVEIGVPVVQGDNALVAARATWKVNDKPMSIEKREEVYVDANGQKQVFDNRISVRVNRAMGVDAIKGKAIRKIYGEIYERLTGMAIDSEDEAIETVGVTVSEPKPPPATRVVVEQQAVTETVSAPSAVAETEAGPRKANLRNRKGQEPAEAPPPAREPGDDEVEYDDNGEVVEQGELVDDDGQTSIPE